MADLNKLHEALCNDITEQALNLAEHSESLKADPQADDSRLQIGAKLYEITQALVILTKIKGVLK